MHLIQISDRKDSTNQSIHVSSQHLFEQRSCSGLWENLIQSILHEEGFGRGDVQASHLVVPGLNPDTPEIFLTINFWEHCTEAQKCYLTTWTALKATKNKGKIFWLYSKVVFCLPTMLTNVPVIAVISHINCQSTKLTVCFNGLQLLQNSITC